MTTSDKGVAVTETAQKEGTYVLGAVAAENEAHNQIICYTQHSDEILSQAALPLP